MNRPILELNNISAAYDKKTVLTDVNLTVRENDFLGIIGPNGGGKTTLVRIILGLLKPAGGNLRFFKDGQPSDSIKIGYLPQYNRIDKAFPISVKEVIQSGLCGEKGLFRRYTDEQKKRVDHVIHDMGLEGLEHRAIGQLSGGQMQRALLGRAVVSEPDLVILDEPDTYLDKRFEAKLYEILEAINHRCAIILVSHDIGEILRSVKSIACVNRTLDYHPDTEISAEWVDKHLGCPIDLLGHGELPHRVLKAHEHHTHTTE